MTIQSVKRAMDLLDVIAGEGNELGVTEVARILRINKSTAARLMSTLESGHYLVQNAETRKYKLGGKILSLSAIILSKMQVREVAAPHLRKLGAKINETVSLYIRDGLYRVGIDRVESNHEIRTAFQIGHRGPLHAGASGKLLLAFLPYDKREKLVEELELQPYTDHTITDKNILRKELNKIRELELSISIAEYTSLFSAISVPIRDHTGSVVAALDVTGIASGFSDKKIEEYSQVAKETATAISKELGYLTIKK